MAADVSINFTSLKRSFLISHLFFNEYVWRKNFMLALVQGKMVLHYGDLIDGNCLVKIINTTRPTEIYNLGAQSHVKVSRALSSIT